MELTISKHAKERYAERIMDRDSKTDIIMFIRDHQDKIQQDIQKMVEYGEVIYKGKTSANPKKDVTVSLNGSWVVLWDPDENNVITLYRIDLGVGEDVNKAFIESAYDRIKAARQECSDVAAQTEMYAGTYNDIIEKGEANLLKYRKLIKDIERQISGCREMIQSLKTDNDVANEKLREAVEVLIGRQKF